MSNPSQPAPIGTPFAKSHAINAVHPATGLIATAYSRNSLTTPGAVLLDVMHEAYKALFAVTNSNIIAISSELQPDNTQKGNINILDSRNGRTLAVKHRFRARDATISAVSFHPDLPILATGSPDHSLKLWHYEDASLLQTFPGIEGMPRSLSFSPNGHLLATDGRDRAVRIFTVD